MRTSGGDASTSWRVRSSASPGSMTARWKAPVFEEAPKLPGGEEIRKSPIASTKVLPQGGFSERRKELLPSGPVLLKKKVEG